MKLHALFKTNTSIKIRCYITRRPRSYRQLIYHIFNIPEVFLNYFQNDTPYTYEALLSILPDEIKDESDLYNYAQDIKLRFERWWSNEGKNFDFSKPANVYYGVVSFHEVLERTAWHSGQHCRQVELLLKDKLNIVPKIVLNESLFQDFLCHLISGIMKDHFLKALMMVKLKKI